MIFPLPFNWRSEMVFMTASTLPAGGATPAALARSSEGCPAALAHSSSLSSSSSSSVSTPWPSWGGGTPSGTPCPSIGGYVQIWRARDRYFIRVERGSMLSNIDCASSSWIGTLHNGTKECICTASACSSSFAH